MNKHVKKLQLLLDSYKISYSITVLEKEFLTNPNHNNFYGLTQILEKLGLATSAKKIEFNQAYDLERPFIAQISNPDEICVVEKMDQNFIAGISEDGIDFNYKKAAFQERWSGYILEPDAPRVSKSNYIFNNILNRFIANEENLLVSLLTLFFLLKLRFDDFTFFNCILFLTNLIGLYVSYQLFKLKNTGNESKFCKSIKGGNCTTIINSAKFLNLIDYDKIGIIYFLFFSLIPLLASYQITGMLLLFISTISSFFPIYSIFYQKYVMKSWCPLCLVVQAILLVNFILLAVNYNHYESYLQGITDFIFTGMLALIFSSYYFKSIKFNQQYINTQKRLNEFIKNESIFNFLSSKNIEYISLSPDSKITIGPATENEITFVTNPFCRYCVESYQTIKKLAHTNQSYRLNIIYLAGSNEVSIQICKKLIAIYFQFGENEYIKAVDQWYAWGYNNYQKWERSYPTDAKGNADLILATHDTWAIDHKISFTPSLLLNNRLIPIEYQINDLNYI